MPRQPLRMEVDGMKGRMGMVLLMADQYVGRGRGKVGGVVGGKLPVGGVGRQEVNQVGGGGGGKEEGEEETKCFRQHCCYVGDSPLCVFKGVLKRSLRE